MKIFLSF